MKTVKVITEFIDKFNPTRLYKPGEVVAFDDARAADMVTRKLAVLVGTDEEKKQPVNLEKFKEAMKARAERAQALREKKAAKAQAEAEAKVKAEAEAQVAEPVAEPAGEGTEPTAEPAEPAGEGENAGEGAEPTDEGAEPAGEQNAENNGEETPAKTKSGKKGK